MAPAHSDDPPDHGSTADADAPPPDRELTVIEMMDGPGRPTERTRMTVLWIALAFVSMLMSLTLGVIYTSGLDVLELIVVVMLAAVIFVLIGALRYRGADPMAQFEPQPIPKRRLRRGKVPSGDRGDRGQHGNQGDLGTGDEPGLENDSGEDDHLGDPGDF